MEVWSDRDKHFGRNMVYRIENLDMVSILRRSLHDITTQFGYGVAEYGSMVLEESARLGLRPATLSFGEVDEDEGTVDSDCLQVEVYPQPRCRDTPGWDYTRHFCRMLKGRRAIEMPLEDPYDQWRRIRRGMGGETRRGDERRHSG